MKIEDQVCTRVQAKTIQSFGIELDTLWRWYHRNRSYWVITYPEDCKSEIPGDSAPAYTVAELGVLLGKYTVMKYADDKNWRLYDEKGILNYWTHEGNEAQARADALIWLIDKGYVKPEDLKL